MSTLGPSPVGTGSVAVPRDSMRRPPWVTGVMGAALRLYQVQTRALICPGLFSSGLSRKILTDEMGVRQPAFPGRGGPQTRRMLVPSESHSGPPSLLGPWPTQEPQAYHLHGSSQARRQLPFQLNPEKERDCPKLRGDAAQSGWSLSQMASLRPGAGKRNPLPRQVSAPSPPLLLKQTPSWAEGASSRRAFLLLAPHPTRPARLLTFLWLPRSVEVVSPLGETHTCPELPRAESK